MNVAMELFFQQGYRATGINEVIDKSGVAKATFYNHFRSKDELALEYLREMKRSQMAYLEHAIEAADGPVDRFLAIVRALRSWLLETRFRGCPFVNMSAEIPDSEDRLRAEGREIYDFARRKVRELAEELIASDAGRYAHLDAKELTGDYMVAITGALALAAIYHAVWPIDDAIDAVRRLIGDARH